LEKVNVFLLAELVEMTQRIGWRARSSAEEGMGLWQQAVTISEVAMEPQSWCQNQCFLD